MSASEGMDDVSLKQKLLGSLLREYVRDEKHPFSNHSELLYVVSTVKPHRLLSEWAPQSVGQDLVEDWKSVVDSWVHRLLTLASCNLPDKRWAGICLLGLTCQDCSSERFLASYADWLNKLLSNIQRHYDSVETAIVLKLLSGKCSASVLKKLGYGLSLLPKSRGDEDSWSLMMDKILLYINSQLNDAFQALEEETRSAQTMRALLPPGKESPPPLGGLAASEQTSDLSTTRPEQLLGTRISILMQCCCAHKFLSCIVQLLKEYLGRWKLPDLKIKAYSLVKVLLMSMGVGIAIHIGQGIVNNVFSDLDFLGVEKDGKNSGPRTKVSAELSSESRQKKRKHSVMVRSSEEQPAHDGLEVEMSHNLTPVAVKIAALEALEALLTVGGSMRSESWRGNVDNLLITVAANACKGGLSTEERKIFLSGDTTPTSADFQLTALRALLASLLSPGRVCPSHLALSLELFHRGVQETSTKLADYCGHALLALKVLIHPMSLPLVDLHSSPDAYKVLSNKLTLGKSPPKPESEDDDLEENWLGNDDELEIQVTKKRQHNDLSLDELPSVKDASITHLPEKIETTVSTNVPNNTTVANNDDYMVESPRFRNAVDDHVGTQSATGAFESVEVEPVTTESSLVENDLVVKGNGISQVRKGMASTSEQPCVRDQG